MLDQVLKALDTEIARLKQARALLTGGGDSVKRKPGRPPKATKSSVPTSKPKKRTMSVEARERIRQAQVKRWAQAKRKRA